MVKRGQTAGEYIALVAGGALFVLIVIVAVNGFFNAPAKQSVIEQGSLVQQQYGMLSKALEKGKPLSSRDPNVYSGIAEAPVDFTYAVQSCVHRVEFWSNLSGNFELTNMIQQNVDPEATGDWSTILAMTENSINEPGFYQFNVNVCNCKDICTWLYADDDGNPINQQIEIVPHADPRFINAKLKFFTENQPGYERPPASVTLEANAGMQWTCDLMFPVIEGTATVRGEALQSVQLKCDINGRRIQSPIQNIGRSGQYHLRVQDQNAQGQSTCYVTACNSTNCIDSQHRDYQVCQPDVAPAQPVNQDPTANFVVLTLTDPNTLTFNYNVGGIGNTFTAHAIYASTNRGQMQEINRENLGEAIRGLNSQSINVEYGLQEVSNVFGWYVEVCNEDNHCIMSNMQLPRR